MVRRNRRHLRPVTCPSGFEMPDEQDLGLEPETQVGGTGLEPSHAEPDQVTQIVKPCGVIPTVPSSAETQSSLAQPEAGPQVVVS